MEQVLGWFGKSMLDMLIYAAMGCVFLMGLIKCVFPVRANARSLRRSARKLEVPTAQGDRPAWQDSLFLGKSMQASWKRFLKNAEQLDARGMSCNIEDYVNDDTVIYSVGHIPFAEVVPGLLTSLGILGTFIGLMNGLGGLDVSDASRTMESIPAMIGGMTFAFTTSIVGVACSIAFNIINRIASGSAVNAIDDFQDAFNSLIMSRPLDDNVTLICQQEDQEQMLRRVTADIASRLTDGITRAVENSLVPVTQSMNQFIVGQTQTQVEGLSQITQQFIAQMNRSLSGQLVSLGDTLNGINQSQSVTYDALERTMASADTIMRDMGHIQSATENVMSRFEQSMAAMQAYQERNEEFLANAPRVLNGLASAAEEQQRILAGLRESQDGMESGIREAVDIQARMMDTARKQAGAIGDMGAKTSDAMQKSADRLSESCADYAKKAGAMNAALNDLSVSMREMTGLLRDSMALLRGRGDAGADQALLKEIAGMRTAVADLKASVDKMGEAFGGKEAGAE